jgi:hypothetical protein
MLSETPVYETDLAKSFELLRARDSPDCGRIVAARRTDPMGHDRTSATIGLHQPTGETMSSSTRRCGSPLATPHASKRGLERST